jgi:hypothetical protein
VADVTADIDGEVTTDGTWGGCKRVGGTEEDWKGVVSLVSRGEVMSSGVEPTTAGLDSITAFPNHGADWSAVHVYYLLDLFERMEWSSNIQLTSPGKNGLDERSSSDYIVSNCSKILA